MAATKCGCPVWIIGQSAAGLDIRESLRTRDWQIALRRLDEFETGTAKPKSIQVGEGIRRYMAECAARHLEHGTLRSYRSLFNLFESFVGAGTRISEIDLNTIQKFRQSRQVAPGTQRKEIEYLRGLFGFWLDHGWATVNIAKKVKPPKQDGVSTMPFEPDEVKAMLKACGLGEGDNYGGDRGRRRAKALVLTMLYTGLRISDVIQLARTRLKEGKLLMRTMKSGRDLYISLHGDALDALNALPVESDEFFFWSGKSKLDSAINSARRAIDRIGRLAQVKARPHRFRDTFACELLLSGVDIRTVSLLLGHSSVAITERYYAPWVERYQSRLDEAVSRLSFSR